MSLGKLPDMLLHCFCGNLSAWERVTTLQVAASKSRDGEASRKTDSKVFAGKKLLDVTHLWAFLLLKMYHRVSAFTLFAPVGCKLAIYCPLHVFSNKFCS